MPVTIEEFERLRESKFPPLVKYIHKRFGSKQKFLSFLAEKLGDKFPAKPYESLIREIDRKIGRARFLSILGLKDEKEAELRTYLFDALYKGLTEAVWARHLSPLYEKVTTEKIKIVRKADKKAPAHKLAFTADEKRFTEAWIALYKKEVLPVVLHYGKLTVGALGWLKSLHERWNGYYSTVFKIIKEKFDLKSQNIIFNSSLNIIEEVAKNPQKFGVSEELGKQAAKNLKLIGSEKDDLLRYMKSLQLIHSYLNDEDLSNVINELILKGNINPPKVRKLYERFPYSFSDWIVTPYGIFKQEPSWLREPNKKLAEIIQNEFDQKYFEPHLKPYHGEYPLRVLEYCIKENPEKILKTFGTPHLRKVGDQIGIRAALIIGDEEELIRLILLKLGFNLPPILVGLNDFDAVLDKCALRLKKRENLSSVMQDVYDETERVLQDLAYFYICFLWKIKTRLRKPEEIEADINRIVKNLKVSDKPFARLTFGELIKLIRNLNKELRRNKELKQELTKIFGTGCVLPKKWVKFLGEISKYRAPLYAHKKRAKVKPPNRKTCSNIISELKDFSRFLHQNEIYPRVIRVTYQVTDEYGTQYFEGIDDRGDEWTIKYRWLDPSTSYFMHSKTNPVAVNPVIIEKIF